MTTLWTKVTDIPVGLFINRILPLCEVKDVLSLGCTNKFFALVVNDDMLWRRRLVVDCSFTGSKTVRMNGWKFLYQRLNPRVFIWGCVVFSSFDIARALICSLIHSHVFARLQPFRYRLHSQPGLLPFPDTTFSDVPFPVELHLPDVRVVSLAMCEESVQIPFLILANTLISYRPCVPTVLSTRLAPMAVCIPVVRIPLILSISRKNLQILTILRDSQPNCSHRPISR